MFCKYLFNIDLEEELGSVGRKKIIGRNPASPPTWLNQSPSFKEPTLLRRQSRDPSVFLKHFFNKFSLSDHLCQPPSHPAVSSGSMPSPIPFKRLLLGVFAPENPVRTNFPTEFHLKHL